LHECEGNGTDEHGNKVDPFTLEPLDNDVNNVIKIGKHCFNADSYKQYFNGFGFTNYNVDLDEDPLEVWLNEIERNPDIPFRSGFGPVFTREQLINLYNRFSTYEETYGNGEACGKKKRKHNRRKSHKRKTGKTGKRKNKKTKRTKNKRHSTKRHK